MWFVFALGSAVFAALTSILAKIGIEGVNSTLATAIRTVVVLAMSWGMVFLTGTQTGLGDITRRSWLFLIIGVLGGCFGLIAAASPDLMQIFLAPDEVLLSGLIAAFVGLLAAYFVSYRVCVGIYKRKEY